MGKRDILRQLSEVHKDRVRIWLSLDKTPKIDGNTVESVYRHSVDKGTSVLLSTVLNVAYILW